MTLFSQVAMKYCNVAEYQQIYSFADSNIKYFSLHSLCGLLIGGKLSMSFRNNNNLLFGRSFSCPNVKLLAILLKINSNL